MVLKRIINKMNFPAYAGLLGVNFGEIEFKEACSGTTERTFL